MTDERIDLSPAIAMNLLLYSLLVTDKTDKEIEKYNVKSQPPAQPPARYRRKKYFYGSASVTVTKGVFINLINVLPMTECIVTGHHHLPL